MEREFSSKLTGRFVDDDDIVRTGRAWVEIDGFDFLHIPVPAGFEETMDAFASQSAQVAKDAVASGKYASAAKQNADRTARIADSTSWSGDRLTVNGKTSPPLTGPKGATGSRGAPGEVTKSQLDAAIATAITALAPTGLKLVLAAPDDKTAEQADTAIRAKGYGAVVVVPTTGSWWE